MGFLKSQHFEQLLKSHNLHDFKIWQNFEYRDLSQKNTPEFRKSRDLSNSISKSREKNTTLMKYEPCICTKFISFQRLIFSI